MGDPVSLGLAGVGAATNAFKLLQGFVDLRDATKVQALKFELMSLLLETQEAQSALIAEKRQLEERIRQFEAWDREKERYQPETIGQNGSLCYGLKPEAGAADTEHKLCAHCFDRGLKRHLQPHTIPEGRSEVLMCRECSDQILMQGVHDTRALKPGTSSASWGRATRG